MWVVYALLAAVFAALTTILAKVGLKGLDSNVAVAIRTGIVLVMAWMVVLVAGGADKLRDLTRTHMLFLTLSGIATGLSWLFYFKALQLGQVSRVAPLDKFSIVLTIIMGIIFLHEPLTAKMVVGGVLITAGTLVMVL